MTVHLGCNSVKTKTLLRMGIGQSKEKWQSACCLRIVDCLDVVKICEQGTEGQLWKNPKLN